jgi:Fe-S oxidoreductase/coenzyme F420-reducing hydrogenase delta subunit
MCSGRIEPHFILQALRAGADGILVTGCHPGDCHYISGNEKAQVRMDSVKSILDTLGIKPERVRLEWISASEGLKFAQVVTDFVKHIQKLGPNSLATKAGNNPGVHEAREEKTGFEYCIECNKCASSCPITRVDDTYSPSVNVFSKSIKTREDRTTLPRAWDCLTCGTCSQRCPSGVKYEELIRAERSRARAAGDNGHCAHGEALELISEFQTEGNLTQKRLGWLSEELNISNEGDVLYFVGCLPYFEHVLFNDAPEGSDLAKIGPEILNIARSTVTLFNRAGLTPVVLPDERCCGHDSLWKGDEETFKELARINIENIKSSGAKQVVVACAEGFRTLKLDYPKFFGELDFEVLHTTEFFSRLIEEGKLVPSQSLPIVVAFQDPCRLGRHAQVFDAPRKILNSIPDLKLVEVGLEGRDATCCGGPNGWINCGQLTRLIQFQKFREMVSKGANTLVTACPKCLIHFECAANSRLPSDLSENKIELSDINVILDLATRGGE